MSAIRLAANWSKNSAKFTAINQTLSRAKASRDSPILYHLQQRNLTKPAFNFKRNYSYSITDLQKESKTNDIDDTAETTGVLDYENQNEVVLYFDQIYPLSITTLHSLPLFRYLILPLEREYPPEKLKNAVLKLAATESNPLPVGADITEFVPLKRDGGVFAKFQVPEGLTPHQLACHIIRNVNENEIKSHHPPWNRHPLAYQVKGTPWIEDLSRFPNSKLKVVSEGDQLTEEELYFLCRRYGHIDDIVPKAEDGVSSTIIFKKLRSAISAKNCVTGIRLNSGKTTLHIQYVPMKRVNYITDFIINHQRVSIPAILAILATVAVLIFDPIRQWFIESKIGHKYSLERYKDNQYVKIIYSPYKVVKSLFTAGYNYIDDRISSGSCSIDDSASSDQANTLWNERSDTIKQLKLWIHENINTFIVVKGPKGSGKEELVMDHTLGNDPTLNRKVLYIDCDSLVKSRTDNSLLQNTANQLGYFPIFTWINSFSQFIDLGVQGLTGQKSGLSESKETQLKNMLSLTTQALRSVALSDYSSYVKESERRNRLNSKQGNDDEKSSLSSSSGTDVTKEDEYLQQFPEEKPIIVIDKFAKGIDGNNDFVYKLLSDWSSQLIQSNLAHVIYITHDVSSIQNLTDSLPNQVFKTISLSDASHQSAQQYVLNQLGNQFPKQEEVDPCLKPLGGRMLDLQAFVRRIKSGESPGDALNEMVTQAAEQITTFFLNHTNKDDNNWSSAQIWAIMRILASRDSVEFEELNKSPLFKSSNETLATLSTLEKNDLISLNRDKGVLSTISTGRPLYKAAFQDLVGDPKIFKLFETDYYNNLIELENKKVASFEDEISKVSTLSDLSILKERLDYIGSKIKGCTERISGYEDKIALVGKTGHNERKSFLGVKF